MRISEADLLDALALATVAPAEAKTTAELASELGCSRDTVLAGIRRLASRGCLVVHRKQVSDVIGRPQWCPAYTVKGDE